MLNRHERRQLEILEQQLERDEPDFVAIFRYEPTRPPHRDRLRTYVALALGGVLLFVVGCTVTSLWLTLLGATTTIGATLLCACYA